MIAQFPRLPAPLKRSDEMPDSLPGLLGWEGRAAALYFSAFSSMLKTGALPDFHFGARNRRPTRDPVNALLSFAYAPHPRYRLRDFRMVLATRLFGKNMDAASAIFYHLMGSERRSPVSGEVPRVPRWSRSSGSRSRSLKTNELESIERGSDPGSKGRKRAPLARLDFDAVGYRISEDHHFAPFPARSH